jgi:sensor histidine kinase regulating citrate/malate metabolism
MGLACSSTIVRALGGDITLKKSKTGISSFAFKIPVLQLFRPEEQKSEDVVGA